MSIQNVKSKKNYYRISGVKIFKALKQTKQSSRLRKKLLTVSSSLNFCFISYSKNNQLVQLQVQLQQLTISANKLCTHMPHSN